MEFWICRTTRQKIEVRWTIRRCCLFANCSANAMPYILGSKAISLLSTGVHATKQRLMSGLHLQPNNAPQQKAGHLQQAQYQNINSMCAASMALQPCC